MARVYNTFSYRAVRYNNSRVGDCTECSGLVYDVQVF